MLTHDHLADCDSRLFARCSFASLRVEAVAITVRDNRAEDRQIDSP